MLPPSSFLKSDHILSTGVVRVNDEIFVGLTAAEVSSFELVEERRFFGEGLLSPFSAFDVVVLEVHFEDTDVVVVFFSVSEGLSDLEGETDRWYAFMGDEILGESATSSLLGVLVGEATLLDCTASLPELVLSLVGEVTAFERTFSALAAESTGEVTLFEPRTSFFAVAELLSLLLSFEESTVTIGVGVTSLTIGLTVSFFSLSTLLLSSHFKTAVSFIASLLSRSSSPSSPSWSVFSAGTKFPPACFSMGCIPSLLRLRRRSGECKSFTSLTAGA